MSLFLSVLLWETLGLFAWEGGLAFQGPPHVPNQRDRESVDRREQSQPGSFSFHVINRLKIFFFKWCEFSFLWYESFFLRGPQMLNIEKELKREKPQIGRTHKGLVLYIFKNFELFKIIFCPLFFLYFWYVCSVWHKVIWTIALSTWLLEIADTEETLQCFPSTLKE